MVRCPRRLALKVANLAAAQPDREVENAARRFLPRSTRKANRAKRPKAGRAGGITVDRAERMVTDKGEWLLYRAHVKGESAEALLPNMVATSPAKLPIPKLMRWAPPTCSSCVRFTP